MRNTVVSIAVEGDHDAVALKRILSVVGLETGTVHAMGGKGALDQRVLGFNQSARHFRWLIVRDLDQDAKCAPELVSLSFLSPRDS
jgi:hypothetical protein